MIILVECLVLSRFLEEYTGPGLCLQAPSRSRLIQLFCKCSGKEHGGPVCESLLCPQPDLREVVLSSLGQFPLRQGRRGAAGLRDPRRLKGPGSGEC